MGGRTTTDARVVTAIHAVAAALNLLLPSAASEFRRSLGFMLVAPTMGFDSSLTASCGTPEASPSRFDAACLQSWYAADESPSRLGQVIAYELMYFKVRDGWNSLGEDGGCDAGPHFCPRYADTTAYDPEAGRCVDEIL